MIRHDEMTEEPVGRFLELIEIEVFQAYDLCILPRSHSSAGDADLNWFKHFKKCCYKAAKAPLFRVVWCSKATEFPVFCIRPWAGEGSFLSDKHKEAFGTIWVT